ncbi:ABC transporter permease [Pseudalkalibacillus decolorationis]|uniref:ABC transporter permease n=1 Tax=Pseudalkalibacillus decolorationis TaxID=163879 RepID=UPI002148716B|nr:ABC transporter permease [Pseudalkalibacillus decolorationis]
MNGLLGLIQNENMKIYRRPRTWIFAGILLLLIVGGAILGMKFDPEYSGSEWRGQVQQNIDEAKKEMKGDDTPEDFKNMMKQDIAQNQYYLENDINPYEKNAWTFINENLLLTTIVSLFVVVVASDIVASEFTWGTIKMLMVRPFSRGQILFSKFVSVLIFQLVLYIELFVASWLVGGLLFGFGGFNFVDHTFGLEGGLTETAVGETVLKTLGLGFVSLIVIVAISFMISTVLRSSSLAIGIGIATLFAGNAINLLLAKYDWGKFVLFPNLELTTYIGGGSPPFEGMSLPFSLTVDAIYFVVIVVLTWYIFKKRDIAA